MAIFGLNRDKAKLRSARPIGPRQVYAHSTADVQAEVLRCADEGERLRPTGALHPAGELDPALTKTDENQLSLAYLTGVEFVEGKSDRLWVRAGTKLADLAEWLNLHQLGLNPYALNMRPLYHGQTIGAAVATGTPSWLAASVMAVRMVHPDGRVAVYSSDLEPTLLDPTRIMLGAIGVITHLEIRAEAMTHQVLSRSKVSAYELADILDDSPRYNGFVAATWFAQAPAVVERMQNVNSLADAKSLMRTATPTLLDQARAVALESIGESLLVRYGARLPGGKRFGDQLSSRYHASSVHDAVPTQLTVPPQVISYALPFDGATTVLMRIRELWDAMRFRNYAPIRIEFQPADRGWLSPTQGCDTALFTFPYFEGTPKALLEALCLVLERNDARPIWAALPPNYSPSTAHYPRLDEFRELRGKFDPHGVLLNPFLMQICGIDSRDSR